MKHEQKYAAYEEQAFFLVLLLTEHGHISYSNIYISHSEKKDELHVCTFHLNSLLLDANKQR